MLTPLAEGAWVAAAPHSMLGLRLGSRMTVVRLEAGGLWVHSPVRLSGELRAAVDALGPVRHLVAPNLFHHVHAGTWKAAYPDATLHAPAALRRKREDLAIDARLEDAAGAIWAGEIAPLHVDGCLLDETVFLHGASRTLVTADLLANLASSDHLPTRLYFQAAGAYGRPGLTWPLRLSYRDRPAARRSLARLLDLAFDRLVVAHGDPILRDPKPAIRKAFETIGV